MKLSKITFIVSLVIAVNSMTVVQAGTLIPRSTSGDKGRYYLLEMGKKGDIVTTIHKRVGVSYTGYTKTEINCKTKNIRVLGYSEESPSAIKTKPTEWFSLVPGSSKSNLALSLR